MVSKNLRLNMVKSFIASTPEGQERLKIAYETIRDEVKRERELRRQLNYTPNNYEDYER